MPLKTGFLSVKQGLNTNPGHWPRPLIHISGIKQRIGNNHPKILVLYLPDLRVEPLSYETGSYFFQLRNMTKIYFTLQRNIAQQQIFISSQWFFHRCSDKLCHGINVEHDLCLFNGLYLFILFSNFFFFLKGRSYWNKNWKSKLGVEHFLGESFCVRARFKASPMSPYLQGGTLHHTERF